MPTRRTLIAGLLCLLSAVAEAEDSGTATDSLRAYDPAVPAWIESGAIPGDEWDGSFCARPACYFGTVSLDLLALERLHRPDAHDIFFLDDPGTIGLDLDNPVGNAEQLDLPTKLGVRFDMILPGGGCDLNLNILAVRDARVSLTETDPNVFYAFYNAAPVALEGSYTAQYQADLGSIELNVRSRQEPRWAPLAGFRALELEETFNIQSPTAAATSQTDNDLFGVQFGFQGLLLHWNHWRLETSCKAAALYNNIQLTANVENGSLDHDFSHVAFVGDLQCTATYQLGPRLLLRAGYQGLWLEGVALAADQTDNGEILLGRGRIDLGRAVYQGGFLGGEFTY